MAKMTNAKFKKLIQASKAEVSKYSYSIGGDETVEVEVDPNVSVVERASMIQNIIDSLFVGNEYRPYLYTVMFWYWILKTYTKLPFDDVYKQEERGVLNKDVLDAVQRLISSLDFTNDMREAIGEHNCVAIEFEVRDGVECRKQEVLYAENPVNAIFEDLENITSNLAVASEKFKDWNMDDLQKIFEKLGQINDSKIVNFITKKGRRGEE